MTAAALSTVPPDIATLRCLGCSHVETVVADRVPDDLSTLREHVRCRLCGGRPRVVRVDTPLRWRLASGTTSVCFHTDRSCAASMANRWTRIGYTNVRLNPAGEVTTADALGHSLCPFCVVHPLNHPLVKAGRA